MDNFIVEALESTERYKSWNCWHVTDIVNKLHEIGIDWVNDELALVDFFKEHLPDFHIYHSNDVEVSVFYFPPEKMDKLIEIFIETGDNAHNGKVPAIKYLRNHTKFGLGEAKHFLDNLQDILYERKMYPNPYTKPNSLNVLTEYDQAKVISGKPLEIFELVVEHLKRKSQNSLLS